MSLATIYGPTSNLKTKLEFCHFQFKNIENCLGMSLLNVSCHSTFILPGWAGYTKIHIFWEGHKNMTKSPNFFWQNGLLSKFFSNFFDFLKKWAAADKPCPQLQPFLAHLICPRPPTSGCRKLSIRAVFSAIRLSLY